MNFLYGFGVGVISTYTVKPLIRGFLRLVIKSTMAVKQTIVQLKSDALNELEDLKSEARTGAASDTAVETTVQADDIPAEKATAVKKTAKK